MSDLGRAEISSGMSGTPDVTGSAAQGTASLLRSFNIEPFDASKTKWPRWVERLEGAFHLFGLAESSWLPTMLHFMGSEAYDTLADLLDPVKPFKSTYEVVVTLLEQHFNPSEPEIKAVFQFMKRKQGDECSSETVDQYINALRKIAERCNFGEYLNKALRNQFVFGLKDKSVQGRLLEIHNLTLERARDIAKTSDAVSPVKTPVRIRNLKRAREPEPRPEHNYSTEQEVQDQNIASFVDTSMQNDIRIEVLDVPLDETAGSQAAESEEDTAFNQSDHDPDNPSSGMKRRYMEGLDVTAHDIREVLQDMCTDLSVRLDHGTGINKNDKNLVCRTICRHFLGRQVKSGISISNVDKQKIAEAIVTAYPRLGSSDPDRPVESEWFWFRNGEKLGNHTGCIQHWVRNTMSKAQFEGKQRKTKIGAPPAGIEELQNLIESPENRVLIFRLMTDTFSYRQALRLRKKSNTELVNAFPHLLQHGGEMLDHEFNLMYPNRKTTPFESIIPLCLVLEGNFTETSNVALVALLKVMNTLYSVSTLYNGAVKKLDPLGLSPLEDYASVLVRWRQSDQDLDDVLLSMGGKAPFIFIDAPAFENGDYHAIIQGTAYNCGDDFCRALDLVMKAYKVFRYQAEIRAKRLIQFFDVSVYKVYKFSPLTTVNNLCDRLRAAMKNGK